MKYRLLLIPLGLWLTGSCESLMDIAKDRPEKVVKTVGEIVNAVAGPTAPTQPSVKQPPVSMPTKAGTESTSQGTATQSPTSTATYALEWHPLEGDVNIATLFCSEHIPSGVPSNVLANFSANPNTLRAEAAINDSGEVAVWLTAFQDGEGWSGVWMGQPDAIRRILTTGERLPGVEVNWYHSNPGHSFDSDGIGPPAVNGIGKIWLGDGGRLGLEVSGTRRAPNVIGDLGMVAGFWLVDDAGAKLVGLKGETALAEEQIRGGRYPKPWYKAAKTDGEIPRGIQWGIMTSSGAFLFMPDGLKQLMITEGRAHRVLAEVGQPAPGLPGNGAVKITSILPPSSATIGRDSALVGLCYSGPGLLGTGVWLASASGLELVSRDALPLGIGRSDDLFIVGKKVHVGKLGKLVEVDCKIVGMPSGFVMDDGRLMLWNGREILFGSPGSMQPFQLPGCLPGLTGGQAQFPVCSPGGCLASTGNVQGDSGAAVTTLFAGRAGALRPILRVGQRVPAGTGDERVIANIQYLAVNDRGEVLVRLDFASDEGIRDRSQGIFLLRTAKTLPGKIGGEVESHEKDAAPPSAPPQTPPPRWEEAGGPFVEKGASAPSDPPRAAGDRSIDDYEACSRSPRSLRLPDVCLRHIMKPRS